ncbi:hypothetical protein P692DRAFT_2041402 [Suillus brevipes Sb2]|nr:hypothetical protein P692DRAFT_2041402 [Suillus brevipes Sb2]
MAPVLTRNIVIFGETGGGRSSVINLMAGQEIAHTSPDSHRCTLHWAEYPITFKNGTRYKVFDTVGLEESCLQTRDYLTAILNACGLINTLKERGGVNLLLFCIRAGRVTATMQSNYRLFFEFLCEKKVPLALVVTHLEREVRMEDWYTRNMGHLEKHNIRSAGHACITAAILDGRYGDKYEESRSTLRRVVEAHCNASMEGWTGGQGWLTSFIRKLVEFVVGRPKKTDSDDVIGVLTRRCGMTNKAAQQVAKQIRDKNLPRTVLKNYGNMPDVRNTGPPQNASMERRTPCSSLSDKSFLNADATQYPGQFGGDDELPPAFFHGMETDVDVIHTFVPLQMHS